MRQLGTAAREHPERKIKANYVLVTCTYKLGNRPSIPASEVENVRPCAYAGCQPRKAKRVGKTLFARHAIPVEYLRRYDSRRIHRTEINTPQTHLGPCPWQMRDTFRTMDPPSRSHSPRTAARRAEGLQHRTGWAYCACYVTSWNNCGEDVLS